MLRVSRREQFRSAADERLLLTDPGYRGRVLAVHENLDREELDEVTQVYSALGYPDRCITITHDTEQERAA